MHEKGKDWLPWPSGALLHGLLPGYFRSGRALDRSCLTPSSRRGTVVNRFNYKKFGFALERPVGIRLILPEVFEDISF